ncbi:hypothetical protein GJ744_004377 [Endocarpon pusillum]|uniref:Uncharacterized protein n=1 Tax=Endocarpon pusillum TaxID=364733 RepID=A0A8H7ATG9_9EURO|nr:hypothetical protein GJ744_004377 [Endocarpon pusillum]
MNWVKTGNEITDIFKLIYPCSYLVDLLFNNDSMSSKRQCPSLAVTRMLLAMHSGQRSVEDVDYVTVLCDDIGTYGIAVWLRELIERSGQDVNVLSDNLFRGLDSAEGLIRGLSFRISSITP